MSCRALTEPALLVLIFLVAAGFVILFFTPREKTTKSTPRKNEFEWLDDFGMLLILVKNRRYDETLKKLKKLVRKEQNAERRLILKKLGEEVKKAA